MQQWLIFIIEQYGYIGILILMMIENIFPPIPSEIILTFAGFMASKGYLSILGVITLATLGSYLGSLILYMIGRIWTIEKILASHLMKYLRFQKHDFIKTEQWFFKHGKKAILIGRLVPVIRSLISLPAGLYHMSFFCFSLYTLLGTLLWNTLLVFIGSYLGNQWEILKIFIRDYEVLWIIGILCMIGYWFMKKLLSKR